MHIFKVQPLRTIKFGARGSQITISLITFIQTHIYFKTENNFNSNLRSILEYLRVCVLARRSFGIIHQSYYLIHVQNYIPTMLRAINITQMMIIKRSIQIVQSYNNIMFLPNHKSNSLFSRPTIISSLGVWFTNLKL